MFVNFKKFLFKSRIMTNSDEQARKTLAQIKNYPFQQIHLREEWDQTYRKMDHPDLQNSPIFHLTKAVGRITMTPHEMAKAYLTDPDLRKQMTLLTLDPKELERIYKDILDQPEKYQAMLKPDLVDTQDSAWVYKKNRDMATAKANEEEYWFRVVNDGRFPQDNWPMAREYHAYKEWVETIEDKAYNTLLTCVQQAMIYVRKGQENATYDGKLSNLRAVWSTSIPTKDPSEVETERFSPYIDNP